MDGILKVTVHIEMRRDHEIVFPAFETERAVTVFEIGIDIQAVSQFLCVRFRVFGREQSALHLFPVDSVAEK